MVRLEVKHVPEWFPGAGFKHFAKEGRRLYDIAVDGPLKYVEYLTVSSRDPRKPVPGFGLTMVTSKTEATSRSLRRVMIV